MSLATEMYAQGMPKDPVELRDLLECRKTLVIERVPRFVPMGGGKGIPGSKASVLFENYGFIKGPKPR